MSKQTLARSLLRTARNRVSLFSPSSSSILSSECSSINSRSYSQPQSSSLHTVANNVTLKSCFPTISESKNQSPFRPSICGSPLVAKLSTAEVSNGTGTEDVAQTIGLEDSESVDDSDATSSRSTPDNIYWIPVTTVQSGRATSEGTQRFASKFNSTGRNHFRTFGSENPLTLSSIGLGTYLGTSELRSGQIFQKLIEMCLENGVNVFDTSGNNLDQYSERVIGHTIASMIEFGKISRDEIFVSTKGGFIPREHWKTKVHTEEYLQENFISIGLFEREDVSGQHCLAPSFLNYTLNTSLKNFGLDCIDLYYLQNVETHIGNLPDGSKELFYERMKTAFEFLESACEEGKIGHYGISCRNENLTEKDSENFISLQKLVDSAKSVAGENNHFKFLQTPYNALSLDIEKSISQNVNGEELSTVDAAKALGLNVVSASSNYHIRIYKGSLDNLDYNQTGTEGFTAANQALQFTRSRPNVLTALFSTRGIKNVESFLNLVPHDA